MLGELRALAKESVIYGLSTVAARLLNFLLLPFYTHYLLPAEYGVVTTVYSYIAFLNILYHFGMDQAYMRYAAKREEGALEEKFSTAFWPMAAAALALSSAIHLGAVPVAGWIGLSAAEAPLIRYAAWILALDSLAVVPFAELRLEHRAWTFAGIKAFNIVLNLAANVALLAGLGLGVRGVFLASAAAAAGTAVLLAPVLALRLRPVLDRALLSDMLRFALPLLPAGLGAMAIQVIDRPILLAFTDKATVGLYQANYRLGVLMMLLVSMFDQAWRPFYLQRAGRPDAPAVFARVLTYWVLAAGWAALALSLFIGDLVRVPVGGEPLIDEAYWPGLGVVPVVLGGYLLHGVYVNFMASVQIAKRTGLLAWITLAGAGVNVAANLLLIPRLGMMGAAWAMLLAYAATSAGLYLAGRRVHPIPYEYGRLAALAGTGAACALAWRLLAPWAGTLPYVGQLAAKAAFLAAVPLALWLGGFPTPDERAVLKRIRALTY